MKINKEKDTKKAKFDFVIEYYTKYKNVAVMFVKTRDCKNF